MLFRLNHFINYCSLFSKHISVAFFALVWLSLIVPLSAASLPSNNEVPPKDILKSIDSHQQQKPWLSKTKNSENIIKPSASPKTVQQVNNVTTTDFNSMYFFEGNLLDESANYEISLSGDEVYASRDDKQVLHQIEESWLDIPLALGQNINTDKSFFISVDFMIPNVGVDESARFIFGNKGWGYADPGFKLVVFNEKEAWQPNDKLFVDFNIGVGTVEIAKRFYDVPMDVWQSASMFVDFENDTVTFGLNGRLYQQSLRVSIDGADIDPTEFIQSLSEQNIRIGAPWSADGTPPPFVDVDAVNSEFPNTTSINIAEMQVDNLQISSPRPAGDPALVISALDQFTAFLEGSLSLDDETTADLLTQLRMNLPASDFNAFAASARAFIAAHATNIGALYKVNEEYKVYDDFSSVSKAYVDLGVWMMEEGLTINTIAAAHGIVFAEHTSFPGTLPTGAERIDNATTEIRAQYVTDPWYRMGGMATNSTDELSSYLYRPTGFYAPAGEKVTITVDPALVDSGLHIRVGGQKENHLLIVSTNRFPVIKVDYRIDSASFDVINPMGGGIYVLVPQGVDLGWIDLQVDGAVRAPYFSLRAGHETPIEEWSRIRDYPGVFAEFESDKYLITVPAAATKNYDSPDLLLQSWDKMMDIYQVLHGRPLERSRAEAFMLDSASAVVGSYPGGYPVTPGLWAQGPVDIKDGTFSPFALLNEDNWLINDGFYGMLHEMGHHHFGRFINIGEQESFVNVPMAAMLTEFYDKDYDEAMMYSGYQTFTRTDAAIDWMVTANFRNGDPIGVDPTTDFEPLETSYQARGHAKYLDLADTMGGWEAVGKVYQTFYEEDEATGIPASYTAQEGVSHDKFLQNGSKGLGCNLASLFHFWGIHPSESVASELALMPACAGARERIELYLSAAPRTNEDLRAFHTEKTLLGENQLKFQIYDLLLPAFDETYGQQIRTIGAEILNTYFDINPDGKPSKPELTAPAFDLSDSSTEVTFSWTPSIDPEGKPLKYSWKLFNADSGETLISRSWVEGNSVAITKSDLALALEPYISSGETSRLAQQVTTSDIFWVVTSETLNSIFNGVTAILDDSVQADFSHIISDNSVIFSDQSLSAEPLIYLWDFGDGTTSTESSPTHTYTAAGLFAASLTVSNQLVSDSLTVEISIGTPLLAEFNTSHSSQTVTFNNQSVGGLGTLNYSWNFGDGTTSIEASPTHLYATAGEYLVELVVTDSYDNSQQIAKTIAVVANKSPANSKEGSSGGVISLLWSIIFTLLIMVRHNCRFHIIR
ncbi:PKD domain-containing protein [Colwelliaceae bacterium 6471]